MNRTVATNLICLCLIYLYSGCGKNKSAERGQPKGDVFFGDTLNLNESERVKSLLHISVNELNAYHVASQVYEGLVKYDPFDLSVKPALACRWEISADKTEYTFHLRSEVRFHNDSCFEGYEGRQVNSEDVKYCFHKLCSRHPFNTQFEVTFKDRVLGASEYYATTVEGVAGNITGLTLPDDSTVKIKLVQPDANFINILSMPGCYIYPKEADLKYGTRANYKPVGTGPFYIEKMDQAGIKMKRNINYWAYDKYGNQLPYLDEVNWSFINNKSEELANFNAGKLDMVYGITSAMLGNTLARSDGKLNFEIFSSPALTTEYYCFNVQVNPFFSIKEIRKAFNLAIDRQKINELALNGEGRIASHGLVPYTEVFEKGGYDYNTIKPFPFNPDSAKKLLAAVGYNDGKGLPDFNLEINDGGGERNMKIATEVQKMLKENIGVRLNINVVPWPIHIENIQTGKSDFFRYAWVSDYPDPESFLTLFYGKNVPENFEDRSYINLGHFKNATFDSCYVLARAESDKTKRYKLYSKAEKILMEEAGLLPLFYDENMRLVNKNVKNLLENPLNYIDLSVVYRTGTKKVSETPAQ